MPNSPPDLSPKSVRAAHICPGFAKLPSRLSSKVCPYCPYLAGICQAPLQTQLQSLSVPPIFARTSPKFAKVPTSLQTQLQNLSISPIFAWTSPRFATQPPGPADQPAGLTIPLNPRCPKLQRGRPPPEAPAIVISEDTEEDIAKSERR